jgi:hypothetical protein
MELPEASLPNCAQLGAGLGNSKIFGQARSADNYVENVRNRKYIVSIIAGNA